MSLQEAVKPYDRITLLLQGGGALGAYQAGIYEGIHNSGIRINSISGISIGALNTAVIAGNPPEKRVEALRGFWETITRRNYTSDAFNPYKYLLGHIGWWGQIPSVVDAFPYIFENSFLKQQLRTLESSTEAFQTMLEGQRGFFKPRYQIPFYTTPNHLSHYTTDQLYRTLERFCDLDLVNRPDVMRVSVSAVNVRSGNYAVFCNENEELRYEHFIASGALPPGFPAVEIDGEFYWDGGMVSNTPLNDILEHEESLKQLIFQVDLWDARGNLPDNMKAIDERIKDIQYSSKTRMITDVMGQRLRYNRLIKELLAMIPDKKNQAARRAIAEAEALADVGVKNVIHLIYRKKSYERGHKDYEFSSTTMHDHWDSGLHDITQTFRHTDWFELPPDDEIFVTHDIHDKRRQMSQKGR